MMPTSIEEPFKLRKNLLLGSIPMVVGLPQLETRNLWNGGWSSIIGDT